MNVVKRIPIGIAGLALALASLGNNLWFALGDFGFVATVVRVVCGFLATGILIALITRMFIDKDAVIDDYRNVAVWTVTPTIFMATEVLSTYLEPYLGIGATFLWALALTLQLMWVGAFFWRYVIHFDINNVLPSWLIVFVGYVVGTTTSITFDAPFIGLPLLVSGLVCYVLISPVIMYRFFIVGNIEDDLQPLAGIILAPANLCMVGYLALVGIGYLEPMWWLIKVLLACSATSFVFYLLYCVPRMFRPFCPTFSGFTFPIVITSVAITQLSHLLIPQLTLLARVLQIMATVVVVYVFVRYMIYLFAPDAQQINCEIARRDLDS
ncbi:MAG: TDT family transporter [Coriobacteriia bacterium]|nr:TDT family transporter [Coriobacteriia bacterium]